MFNDLVDKETREEFRRKTALEWKRFKWWFKVKGFWWAIYAISGVVGLIMGMIVGIMTALFLLAGA